MDLKAWQEKLKALKYPILVLLIGVALMLLPPKGSGETVQATEDLRIQQTLSQVEGIGEVRVLLSEHGAVVVCQGADNAAARLAAVRAVSVYTGFGSDRITVLKLAR